MCRVSLGVLFTPPAIPSINQGVAALVGDIDGDGKVDYLTWAAPDGSLSSLRAWRNGGVGVPTFWLGKSDMEI